MSFTSTVKEELCQVNKELAHCKMAEFEALLRFGSCVTISNHQTEIVFSSLLLPVIRHFISLLHSLHDAKTELISQESIQFKKHTIYNLHIISQVDVIIDEFDLLGNNYETHQDLINRECCMKSYLRGAFIAKGSVNDPKTSNYHLEIVADNESEALFIQRLINNFDLNAKISKRRGHLVIYLKDINNITDFLRIIGASDTIFQMEDTMIKREISSNISRIMNCEIANEAKTLVSAKEQLRYIRYLEYNYPLDKLDNKLLMVIKERKENPEASLQELIVILNDKYGEVITKSGLNHRFRRIKEIAIDYQNNRKG